MPLSPIQRATIDIFETSGFMKISRAMRTTREKRLLLHDQFLEFMRLLKFVPDYHQKSYDLILDLFEILHLLDVELVVKMAVQFNLWGETIYRLGTKKHLLYLTKTANLEIFGCFAMTEIGHGSNIAKLETTATYNYASDTFTINSPTYSSHKYWIGQAERFAQYAIVFAQLYIRNVCYGVHPFIVQLRDIDTHELAHGIEIRDCGVKNGLNSIDNGEIIFDNVNIPYNNLLDKFASINNGVYLSEKGRFSKMLNELTKNRFGLGEGCTIIAKYHLKQTIQYCSLRKQFGSGGQEKPIMELPSHHKRLFPLLAKSILLKVYTTKQREYLDMQEESHISSIISKYMGSTLCLTTLRKCREACGGHGYHADSRFGNVYKDMEIYTTFEGDNTVLLQQLFQNYLKQARPELNTRSILIYEGKKFHNRHIAGLDECFFKHDFSIPMFLKNLTYIIEYKVIHFMLLLREQFNLDMDPRILWRHRINEILAVSTMIAVKHMLIDIMESERNIMTDYLIKLFIVDHIKTHISFYAECISSKQITNIHRYSETLYAKIYYHLDYYLYLLDVPDILFLTRTSHLNKLTSHL